MGVAQVVNSNTNTNGNNLPVSNATLPSTASSSNNSNSGVNPKGNPGTIVNSTSNSSSGGFKTPTPPFEPGTKLSSGGNNIIMPNIPSAKSMAAKKDTFNFKDASVQKNKKTTLTDAQKTEHIDSMIRAIDRRRENRPLSNTNRTTKKKKQ